MLSLTILTLSSLMMWYGWLITVEPPSPCYITLLTIHATHRHGCCPMHGHVSHTSLCHKVSYILCSVVYFFRTNNKDTDGSLFPLNLNLVIFVFHFCFFILSTNNTSYALYSHGNFMCSHGSTWRGQPNFYTFHAFHPKS